MIALRKAEKTDVDVLYQWRNDSRTRNYSFNTEIIPYSDHLMWFENMMENSKSTQYIMMNGSTPIGQARIDVYGDNAEISYVIAPTEREKGYGKMIIQLVKDKIREEYPQVKRIIGKVKPDNKASIACFETNGFGEEYRVFEFKLQSMNKICAWGGRELISASLLEAAS